MPHTLTRRSLLKASSLALAADVLSGQSLATPSEPRRLIHLNLNENDYGPSPRAILAVQRELTKLSRYAEGKAAEAFVEQIAAHERVHVNQIVLGEILGPLGLYLGTRGGSGGEFIYSTPGYLALIDSAAHVGGVGIPVGLNQRYENDLPALGANVSAKTRALYLINPHNPTGTVNDSSSFKDFLHEISQRTTVIVDEAYLEYTVDCASRSAVSLVREGANVLVFRTFDKIHGLAGLPMGYTLAPAELSTALRSQGLGEAESLGRLNIAAASAALDDTAHVRSISAMIATERAKWIAVLDELELQHTDSQTNFIFFDAGHPQSELATAMRTSGVEIGRSFPPYTNWARITIGLPEENRVAQRRLREVLRTISSQTL